jgi:LysM repeat protein
MAYVHPGTTSHDIAAAAVRLGTRFVAITAYAVAVAVAFVILSPVLPSRGSEATAVVPTGRQPVLYTTQRGDTPPAIAASKGISLAQLYALNPSLTPLGTPVGQLVVIGLR